ncbi:hypothetical protein SAMN06297251_11770 [Fulvimarina manganoxydans]|uniref:Uncharacterized protein n=1 Tax=Fulvimarina manganoxydans TaxID=937218 RepID=A0A1W2DS29_9HYPH|nr:hypothetical protein [Fulvimarina manganoxydans]SMD00270.1 hypothetical protein SAMN06297251_11770 [Fulvimarina manganoxydans]
MIPNQRNLVSLGFGSLLGTAVVAAALTLSVGSVSAQDRDESQPRAIPEGFVLPGPAPTNAPNVNADGTLPTPENPAASPAGEEEPADGQAAGSASAPSSMGGTNVAAPETVVGPASSTSNPMAFASRPEEGTTNWPCVQRKVETIQPAQVWAGPPLDTGKDVALTPDMRSLIDRAIARRISGEEAQQMVRDFLADIPDDRKEAVGTALFAEMLRRLNAERTQILAGIERYGSKQKALAAALRKKTAELERLQREAKDITAINDMREQVVWDTRIFDERRHSLTYVCEVPVLIEQRAFALGREIGQIL